MVMGLFSWSDIWIYLLADFLGGAAAAYAFLHVLPAEKLAETSSPQAQSNVTGT